MRTSRFDRFEGLRGEKMKRDKFTQHREEFMDKCFQLLDDKGADYQDGNCVFQSFKNDADAAGITVDQVLLLYLSKHMRVIQKHLAGHTPQSEPIETRLLDAVNYMIFISALIKERDDEFNSKDRCV